MERIIFPNKTIYLVFKLIYFFFIYIALFVIRPQYKPNMKINPTIEIPTTRKYFFDGDDDIPSYMSPRFSITFT